MQLLDEVSSLLTGPFVSRVHGLAQRAINFYTNAGFRVFQQPRLEADQLWASAPRPVQSGKRTFFDNRINVRY